MNQFLNKLEKKFGRYAIPDLIRYVIVLYCAGAALGMINENIYYKYLSLNFDAIFHGQVWRLFTYLFEPYGFNRGMGFVISILFFAIQVNLFFLFGRSLEQAWGTFRFNMYFISGYLLNILAALILYLSPIHATQYCSGFQYIYWAMFFAFVTLNPDMEFLLYFVIPIKAKWLALLDAVYMLYEVVSNLLNGVRFLAAGQIYYGTAYISIAMAIVVAMANFLIYFFSSRDYRRISPKDIHRRKEFKKKMRQGQQRNGQGSRHRCAICGRTELDDENLDFRYCSKCDGNYEYCSDHLFTHQHVKKFM
ncbi:MAG: hypothetical protein J5979_01420 [Lachnospiraceae bacterium]|nr:hypothetical protein [Lachnospiraceae bacterium]